MENNITESQRQKLGVSFGDTVRICRNDVTEEAGVAGFVGAVYGFTTPSKTDVDVVGELIEDYAINVYFEVQGHDVWIEPSLVEQVDHAASTVVKINGENKSMSRDDKGEWVEVKTEAPKKKKPWWKFW